MRGYTQISFKICFSCIYSKPCKNTFELVGTALKKRKSYSTCLKSAPMLKYYW